MRKRKYVFHYFTLADYEETERWLRTQHQRGLKFEKNNGRRFLRF